MSGQDKDEDNSKEGAKGTDLDKTACIESLIDALAKEETRSPKTERKLRGLAKALQYKKEVQYFQKGGSIDGGKPCKP